MSAVGTRIVYVTTSALTPRCENLPTNAILPRPVVGHTPSVYPTSTAITTNSKSTSMSSTSGVSAIGEADVHIDLRKSAMPAGGSPGRSAKLELRELLDLVLASARTPKPAGGDCSAGGNSGGGGASAGGSSLTVAATSGLLRPPVGLVTQLLWRARALDDRGPWILTFSMWWLMQHYFGVGSRMHHVRLRWGHLRLVSGLRDPVTDLPCEAVEYVGPAEFTTVKACATLEPGTGDEDAAEVTHLVRRVYPSSGWAEAEINVAAALSTEPVHQRPNVRPLNTNGLDGLPIRPGPDFVALYKTFARRRQQPSLLADAPFYVQPLNLQNPQSSYNNLDAAWFSVGALGKNRIGALMRNIVDKVVRPNLPRVADAATSAARSACIAAASRAAMALPLTSESRPSSRHDQDDYLASREWLLNKLSCLLGLCTKSAYAPLTDSHASPQTWAWGTVARGERETHRPQVVGGKPASEGQAQIVLLAGGSDPGGSYRIGSTAIVDGEDVKPALIADPSLTANGQQGEAQANSVILLPCSTVLTVASPANSGIQLNSVAPVVTAQGQQPQLVQQRRLLHQTATLTSSHASVLSRNTCQLQQQQCHQKQMPIDARLPVVLEASLVNNGGAGQFAYLHQTPGANSVCATSVKLLLLPSNAKSPADTVSLLSPGLSVPSLEQVSSGSASAATTGTVLSSPVIIPTAGIRPFSAGNLHVLTGGISVATSAPGATTPLAKATNSAPSSHPTSTAYNGLPLLGLKVEQPSPGCGVGPPVSSIISTNNNNTATAAAESHVTRTAVYCRQTDLASTPANQVTPPGYRAQLPVAQLTASPLKSGTNSTAMTSLDYSLHQLSTDNSLSQTGANIFTAVYNPTTGVYTLTPAANLVALRPVAPATLQLTPAPSGDRLLSATGLVSAEPATPVAVIDPVGGASSCSGDVATTKQATGPNGKTRKAVAVFQSATGDCYSQCSAQALHSGLSSSGVSQSEQQQSVDLKEEEPLQLLSLQSVINSASAFQCNDFPAYVEQLFRSGVLGASRPWCLNFTAWFINTLVFGVENRTDHVNLRWGDFSLSQTADSRTEYLHFFNRVSRKAFWLAAGPQSPHSLGFDSGGRGADADGGGRIRCPCPVAIFKALRDRRPPSCLHPCSKFYLQPRSLSKTTDDTSAAPAGTAKAESTAESPGLPGADKVVPPSSHRRSDSDASRPEWFTEHAWGKNKLGGLFAEAARLARLPTIWLRKHRSRNFFPGGGGGSGLCTLDDPAASSSSNSGGGGRKRKAAERNGSWDQQEPSNRAEARVKRQRKRKKNMENNNKGKLGEPDNSTAVMMEVVSEGAPLASTELPPTSGFYSSSSVVDAGELIQLPSSSTILQPKEVAALPSV